MKKLLLFTLLLLQAGGFLLAQTTIVQWNFNSIGLVPSSGQSTATLNLIGGISSAITTGIGTPTDPGPGDGGLNTTDYPTQGTGDTSAGIRINASTVGYSNIHVKFYVRHSNTAARKIIVRYGSGSTTQDVYIYTASTVSSSNPPFSTIQDVDLTALSGANNNGNFQVRFITSFSSGNNYEAAQNSTYGSGGTIRYDLITITGDPTGCGTLATQQATGFRLLKTDNSSAQLALNRGNGTGCLVLCSANTPPTTAPVSGAGYTANSVFGSGSAIGNAYAVYNTQANNPSTHYFNISGLTAGTKYYVAAYEYSSTGPCYLNPGTVDSFYCNSTILYPGDLQFVGFDNAVASGGADAYAITNFKPITRGTSFQIVNARYEAGAAANVRTQRWYAGGNDINDNLEIINVLYTATSPLPTGSVISFDFDGNSSITNIRIGTTAALASFTITSNATNSLLNSGSNPSDPEQLFLTQGKFTPVGTRYTDLYYLLEGHVLHGISLSKVWVDFSLACSAANAAASRESRLPPDIKCLNLYFPTGTDYGYYPAAALHSGLQGSILGQLANRNNWTYNTGSNTTNEISTIYGVPFTVTSAPITTNWTGGAADNNWFNCRNWENLYVPDSTANVSVTATPAANISINAASAAEYSKIAMARNLTVAGTVNLNGSNADKLVVYDSLTIGNAGILSGSGTAMDTLLVRSSILSQNINGLQLSTTGWLALHGNRQIQPITVSLPGTTPVGVAALSLNNPPGISITNGGFESLQKLELLNGILSLSATNGFHYLGTSCSISSPTNYYGEINKGWEKSYIDSKIFVRTSAVANYTAPLGSKQKGVFAPMIIRTSTANPFVYEAAYIGMSHPNTGAADINNPPLYKVSSQEYWTLVCTPFDVANSGANVTLYFNPLSFVGGQGPDSAALRDLRVVQYWDSTIGPRKWRLPSTSNSNFYAGPTVQYGKISMPGNEYAFSLTDPEKCFTLGSTTFLNTLPLQVVQWSAQLQGSRTRLSWQVQQEKGTAFYTVEKSTDGKTFRWLQTVYAAGLPAYTCFDDAPADGWNYYRLKITDADGKAVYTSVEKVWLKHTATFAAFPNPAHDKVFISLPSTAKAIINLYSSDGRKCLGQNITAISFTQLSVKGLPAGWYLLEYNDGKTRQTQKLFIR